MVNYVVEGKYKNSKTTGSSISVYPSYPPLSKWTVSSYTLIDESNKDHSIHSGKEL